MSHTDPYSPPQSSFAGPTPGELDSNTLRYSGFWQRVGAALIDFLVVSPLLALDYFFGGMTPNYALYALLPTQLVALFLHIYMVVTYGGTPGKLAMGLRIATLDGGPVTVKHAILRYSVLWTLSLALAIILIMAASGIPAEDYQALGYMERSLAIAERAPHMMKVNGVLQVWMLACIVSVLANAKRRALHDFIAGTVVLRK